METEKSSLPTTKRNTLSTAILSGVVYLISEITLGTMDIAWLEYGRGWGFYMNATYISLTVVMVISYALFVRGFISLSVLFGNELLKWVTYLLVIATAGIGVLDVSTLSVQDIGNTWMPYSAFAVVFGVLSILFGASLLRLTDGMGELARIAGVLNIAIGCVLLPVVLFFIYPIIMIPTTLVEILLLYRGYEYLSKPANANLMAPTIKNI